jgi:hypothetical protein
MATCRDIITYAMRQAKIPGSGSDPDADELRDGLVALQSLYDEWVAAGMFGRLRDSYQSADYTAREGERIIAADGVVITIPDTIDDDPHSDTRAPRDLSIIETLQDGEREVWLWDRTEWVSLLDLDANSAAPLASRGAWGLAAALAISGAFVTMFGDDAGPDVRVLAARFKTSLSMKYGTTRDGIAGEYY